MARGKPSRIVDGICVAYICGVFSMAWIHASTLTRPWYSSDLSRWLYTVYFLGGAALMAALAAPAYLFSFGRLGSPGRPLQEPQSALASTAADEEPKAVQALPSEAYQSTGGDIDALIRGLTELEAAGSSGALLVQRRRVVEVPRVAARDNGSGDASAPSSEGARIRHARRGAPPRLRGLCVATAAFVAIPAAMLPGVEGFLVTNHQLNTTLILGLAYGWAGLAGYGLLAVRSALSAWTGEASN